MAFSKVDIANLALEHLGKNEIASLTENSIEAKRCNKWIDHCIRETLERSPWTFATKVQALASQTADYEERWQAKHDLPNDMVKVQRIVATYDPFDPSEPLPYEIIGGALYSNEEDVKLRYTFFNDSPTTWTVAKFSLAVSFCLARTIAMPLTRKVSLYDAMDQLYERSVLQAIEVDAAQQLSMYGYENGGYNAARGATTADQRGKKAVDGSIYWTS